MRMSRVPTVTDTTSFFLKNTDINGLDSIVDGMNPSREAVIKVFRYSFSETIPI